MIKDTISKKESLNCLLALLSLRYTSKICTANCMIIRTTHVLKTYRTASPIIGTNIFPTWAYNITLHKVDEHEYKEDIN
jgi:hypothetical protein